MRISHGQAIGQRPYQEDRYNIIQDGETFLLTVFDGHGGCRTVDTLVNSSHEVYDRYKDRKPVDLIKTIYSVLDEKTKDFSDGSTASMVLITPSEVVLAVLGDSPIQVLTKDGEFVMPEHNVRTNYDEAQSAMSRGGVISGGYLFVAGDWSRGLQMSRVFGDSHLRSVTSQIPEIKIFKRGDVQSILLASDGLTDPAHQSAPFLLNKHVTGPELVDRFKNSFDNVTAIVVHF